MRRILPLVAVLLLAACGLKDDLYLPPDNPAPEQAEADEDDNAEST